jgi:hypothetical protein
MVDNFYSESFRAEFFKNTAFAFYSIPGISILQIIVFDKKLCFLVSPNAIFAIFFFLAGLYFTSKAYSIYENLDKMNKGGGSIGKSY